MGFWPYFWKPSYVKFQLCNRCGFVKSQLIGAQMQGGSADGTHTPLRAAGKGLLFIRRTWMGWLLMSLFVSSCFKGVFRSYFLGRLFLNCQFRTLPVLSSILWRLRVCPEKKNSSPVSFTNSNKQSRQCKTIRIKILQRIVYLGKLL